MTLHITSLISQRPPRVGKTTFIAIDGRGGSGKSSLAKELSLRLDAEIIHSDDFASWDNPLGWADPCIEQVFLPIQQGCRTIGYLPKSWWDNHHPEPVTDQPVTNIMILEGMGSLQKKLRPYVSFGIFVETDPELCLSRGVARDLGTGKSESEIRNLWKKWQETEDAYLKQEDPRAYAEIIFDGTKPFREQISF